MARTKGAKPAAKPATRISTPKSKTPALEKISETSKKRKNNDDEEEAPPSPAKKARTTKQPVSKLKPKINQAPSQRHDIFVFGEGSSSELGLGTAKTAIDVKRPRLNPLLSAKEVGILQVACGGMHTAALTHENKILTWGVNDGGALGRDTKWEGGLKDMDDDKSDNSDESDSGLNPLESNPTALPASSFPEDTTFVKLSAGDSHTLALTDDGLVYGWGQFRKTDGVLGFLSGSDAEIEEKPVLLPGLQKIIDICSGANHAMAMDNKGAVFIWGSGEQNQLGYHIISRTGSNNKKLTLKPQHLRTKIKKYKSIYTGLDHSFAIDQNDKVWAWGVNSFGGCGIKEGAGDDSSVVYTPTHVDTLDLENDCITHMAGGQHHSIAITANGKALLWGRVDGHQVGLDMKTVPRTSTIQDKKDIPRIVIVPTELPSIGGKAIYASAGPDHTILINDKGHAYAWGLSATYQTGLATIDDVEVPTHIDNTAVRGRKLDWAGCGGQFSMLTAPARDENMVNGV